jgi:hypothetical protein
LHIYFKHLKRKSKLGSVALPPVILATWEAEIARTAILDQPGQGVLETPSQPTAGHSGAHLSIQVLGRLILGESRTHPYNDLSQFQAPEVVWGKAG